MAKMNKTDAWNTLRDIINMTAEASDAFKKGQDTAFTETLIDNLAAHFAPQAGGGTSTKINEDGDVWCNYYNVYLPAESFATKTNKKGDEVYKSNSIRAEKILRKIKPPEKGSKKK